MLAGNLRALVACMPDNDAPITLPDAPADPVPGLAPVLRVQQPQTMSELWHQRLNFKATQLAHLQHHATGFPFSPQQLSRPPAPVRYATTLVYESNPLGTCPTRC
jgi:hypothetical protein